MGRARQHHVGSTSIPIMVVLVLVACLRPATAMAQTPIRARSDTLSARVRDSIIAAVLADTLPLPDDDTAPVPALRQSFTIRPTVRSYSVGGIQAAEQASYASWVGRFRRGTLRLDATPLSYRGDTSSTAGRPTVTFGGVTPVSARLDLRLRAADTLRVFGQTMSSPGALTAVQSEALGAVGTSTIDLDAGALGITSRIGARYALTQAVGSAGVALTLRGGVEYEPRPSGTNAVSWRGTTLRGLVGISRATEATTVGASIEVTKSVTDSLGGRNLFPGGGQLTADARLLRSFGDDGLGFAAVTAFYSKPVNIQRPDVATRLIPIGDFAGITAAGAIPLGALTVLPTVTVLRETSSASAVRTSGISSLLSASATTGSAGVGLAVPVGRWLTVTPEVGGAVGSVGQTLSARLPRRIRSTSFRDPIRGGWVSVEVSVSR